MVFTDSFGVYFVSVFSFVHELCPPVLYMVIVSVFVYNGIFPRNDSVPVNQPINRTI